MTKIEALLHSKQTVFTTQNLAMIWNIPNTENLWENIKYYTRNGKLKRMKRGIYVLIDPFVSFSSFELSQKIIPISYISLSTALTLHGVQFQYDSTIHAIARKSIKFQMNDVTIIYHQIKDSILLNQLGLIQKDNFVCASIERAICDTLYVYPGSGFDNIRVLNTKLLISLSQIYKNKQIEERVKQMVSEYKEEYA